MTSAYATHSDNLPFSDHFNSIVNTFERGILKCQEQPFSACTLFSVETLPLPNGKPSIAQTTIVSSVGTVVLRTQKVNDKLVPVQITGSFTPDLSDQQCNFYFNAQTSTFYINNINDFNIGLLSPPSDSEQAHVQDFTVTQQLVFRRLMQTALQRLATRVQQALMR